MDLGIHQPSCPLKIGGDATERRAEGFQVIDYGLSAFKNLTDLIVATFQCHSNPGTLLPDFKCDIPKRLIHT
jgi:hypothetical protein